MGFASARRQSVLFVAMLTVGIVVGAAPGQEPTSGIAASKAEVLALTLPWKGERFADGRPRVPDALLERMKGVKIAHAWRVLRGHGYLNQFDGGWKMLH